MEIGSSAPDFTLGDLEGRVRTLADARGQVVVLNFWSAECPWSERGDEILRRLRTQWDGGVAVWAIASNTNESDAEIREAARAREVDAVLLDHEQAVADLYGAVTTPEVFVIDEGGVLRYRGAMDDVTFRKRKPTRNYLDEAVRAVQAGEGPPVAETPGYGCTIVRHAD